MIKKLGRIAMFVAAAAFITLSVFLIIDCVGVIKDFSFDTIIEMAKTGDWSKMSAFTDIGWGILYILVGLTALAVAITGHAGFWSFIGTGLMLGFFIFDLITRTNSGNWADYKLPLNIVFQLVYAGGVILVMYGNHREKKAYRKYKKNS